MIIPNAVTEHERAQTRLLLEELGISDAEYAILNHIHFGCHHLPSSLGKFAASPDYALDQRVTIEETSKAARSCLKRGLVQIISTSGLKRIKHELDRDCIGPIYGFPNPGTVDFTELGAKVWRAIETLQSDLTPLPYRRGFGYRDAVEIKTRWTFVSRTAMCRHRDRLRKEQQVTSMTRPVALDQIRLASWSPPRRGWSFDAVQEYKWQGYMGGGGASFYRSGESDGLDRSQLRRRCKRFGMDPNEWCVLLTLAKWGSYDIRHVVRCSTIFAKSVLKLRISRQDAYQAILRCLESGVLVKLDEKTLRLRTTVCVSPTPLVTDNLRTSRLDFTEKGARLLTELGPTIHGDAWLESWVVEREIFRRVHHYAWNLLDVASVFEEYSRDSAATVKIGPIQELGPWCLYWWKRFDKGYRLEFDITSE